MDGYGTSMHNCLLLSVGVLALALGAAMPAMSAEENAGGYGIGKSPTDKEIRAWDIDVSPTGDGLPSGRGTVKQGAQVFADKCAVCHGATGTEGPQDRLVGGQNTLQTPNPVRTIGSYWPFATTLYDYIHRAMPYNAPQSLSPEETYSVIAWLLYQNQIIREDAVVDDQTLPRIQMPNRNGFVPDPRPDIR